MKRASPRVVLRNWVAEEAIRAAEAGEYAPVQALLQQLARPYDDAEGADGAAAGPGAGDAAQPVGGPEPAPAPGGVCPFRIGGKPPAWAGELYVTCSS
jgi:hypothetical protein